MIARVTASVLFLVLAFCARASDSQVRVAALNPVLAEIATEVGRDDVRVESILRPGGDPHTFNPAPAQVAAIAGADLVLASGLGLEGYLERLESVLPAHARLVRVGDALPLLLVANGERDPHWWNSIEDTRAATRVVARELASLRPALRDRFEEHAARYLSRLDQLSEWARAKIATVPEARRHLVTSHDAFGYFAREWGFVVHPMTGVTDEAEVDAKRVASLIALIRAESIRSVFVEAGVNPRLIQTLVEESGAREGGRLFPDGPGGPGSGAEDYFSMYRANVSAIVDGLAAP
jgi:zinc/manganese transport system substrate-binding protein